MRENIVAKVLFTIGVAIMVIGFITGLFVGNANGAMGFEGYESGMVWSLFFSYLFAGIVSGMLFIGLSEIIKLLHSINQQIGYKSLKPENTYAEPNSNQTSDKQEISKSDEEKIQELYAGEHIQEIVSSILEGYYLVKITDQNGKQFVRVVDVDGFGAMETNKPAIRQQVIAWYNNKDK